MDEGPMCLNAGLLIQVLQKTLTRRDRIGRESRNMVCQLECAAQDRAQQWGHRTHKSEGTIAQGVRKLSTMSKPMTLNLQSEKNSTMMSELTTSGWEFRQILRLNRMVALLSKRR